MTNPTIPASGGMSADTKPELLACPFCGGTNIFIEPDELGSGGQWVPPIHVGCSAQTGCGAEQCEDTEEEAIAAWNRRTAVSGISATQGETFEPWVAREFSGSPPETVFRLGGYLLADLFRKTYEAGRASQQVAAPAGVPELTDSQIRAEWICAGGRMHGPNVETVRMAEADYFKFRRQLAGSTGGDRA